MKTLELQEMVMLSGGHTSPGQCAALSIIAVGIGIINPLAGFGMALVVGVTCG